MCRPGQRRAADVFHHTDIGRDAGSCGCIWPCTLFLCGLFKEGSLKSLDRTLASSERRVRFVMVVGSRMMRTAVCAATCGVCFGRGRGGVRVTC